MKNNQLRSIFPEHKDKIISTLQRIYEDTGPA